jgi:UPF0176 protein
MNILNIAGYKFLSLTDTASLQAFFLEQGHAFAIKGTILLSHEGINLNLAGLPADIQSFLTLLKNDARFMDMTFHESYSTHIPFKYLKVKIKNEIITLRQPSVNPVAQRAPDVSPQELKQWLDEQRDITLLDTRNDYEVRFGTFDGAVNLHIDDFGELPSSIACLERNKPVVMFCTGGIRCEKAALYMHDKGFSQVYQLDGGILGYFKKVGGAHYEGECFVFDERVSVDNNLQCTGTVQCLICYGPVSKNQPSCPACSSTP